MCTEGHIYVFVVLLAYSFIVFVLTLHLRPLREIKIRVFLFSRKDRRERKVLFTFRISRLRWSGRKLRYDKSAQRVLSTPSPPAGVETDPSPALPCMGGSSYNRLVPHQQNMILPSLVANGVLGGLTECQSVLHEGSNLHCDARTGKGVGPTQSTPASTSLTTLSTSLSSFSGSYSFLSEALNVHANI